MLRDVLKLGMLLETEAYARGRRAFADGAAVADNPYLDKAGQADWDLGWRAARQARAANENRPVAEADPYAAGDAAAAAGQSALDNPYLLGHPGFDAWRLGWAARKVS